jgi:hypothetical protein
MNYLIAIVDDDESYRVATTDLALSVDSPTIRAEGSARAHLGSATAGIRP